MDTDKLALRALQAAGDSQDFAVAKLRYAAAEHLRRSLESAGPLPPQCGCRACGNEEGARCPAVATLIEAFALATGERPPSRAEDPMMTAGAERFYDALIAVFLAGHSNRQTTA